MTMAGKAFRSGSVVLALVATFAIGGCGDASESGGSGDADAGSAMPSFEPLTSDGGGGAPDGEPPTDTDAGPTGGPDDNIVGGTDVDIAEFPWVVALRVSGKKGDNFCGGALIGEGAVMTAAHCVTLDAEGGGYNVLPPSVIEVVLGRSVLSDESGGQVVQVAKVWTAKDFKRKGLANDYAVLSLASDVTTPPIALPAPSQTDLWTVGQETLTLGWGCEFGPPAGPECGERPGDSPLKGALLAMQNRNVCTQEFGSLDASHLCMKSTTESAGICQGDSGGPFVVYDDGKPFLVGVTSFNALNGECNSSIPQGAAFVPRVTTAEHWLVDGIWNVCEGTKACPHA
ncbi:MAG TPA: serine protease [Nocardioides sp.]|uniref:S1 family peptidase n=1 Tax=uncultured Nocardioides sp. TaxID=198441 RepID=UPI000EEAF341|nr:serine protease [uncultured Nocardioides sp.]HCB05738.1 hypothetical protein [Nocardioides sp.]HRD62242.1 serine protease [Nocardioides sp.]HRI95242.1 serine protease [Nocardioides sp.]HRK46782.1 serine protease [Nocardioides sp.]